jgi:hypothetical protein
LTNAILKVTVAADLLELLLALLFGSRPARPSYSVLQKVVRSAKPVVLRTAEAYARARKLKEGIAKRVARTLSIPQQFCGEQLSGFEEGRE